MKLKASLILAALVFGCGVSAARADQTITLGHISGPSPIIWPLHIAVAKGLFAANGINLDLVYTQTNAAIAQQLVAGAIDMGDDGIVGPVRAMDQGAPIAILMIESDVAPFTFFAIPQIKTVADLKGKEVANGGIKDITQYYADRMFRANGFTLNDVDQQYAASTAARFAALKSGVAVEAILTAPISFEAQREGYVALADVKDYVNDVPFSAYAVSRSWAASNIATIKAFQTVYYKAVDWFYDKANRAEAIKILIDVSHASDSDASDMYDYYQRVHFFSQDRDIPRQKLAKTNEMVQSLGGVGQSLPVDKMVIPELTKLTGTEQ